MHFGFWQERHTTRTSEMEKSGDPLAYQPIQSHHRMRRSGREFDRDHCRRSLTGVAG